MATAQQVTYAPAMDPDTSPLERAFELARSGRYSSMSELKQAVAAEGYATNQITGHFLARQLKEVITDAKRAEK